MLKFKRVIVGISGGVDSAVAALFLKQRGYDVQGVFMQNWDITDEKGFCTTDADYNDALLVCDKLQIPLHKVNFVKQYWNEVFCNLMKEYENGNTPNPDILCNRFIKFNYFYDYAINKLNGDAIATGHYAKTSFGPYLEHYNPNTDVRLYHAADYKKDQCFFLCQIEQKALRRTMFPLGEFMKSHVKQIAIQHDLIKIAKKKESMGICFIGNRKFKDFIGEYIPDRPGDFINIDNGKIVGQHNGVHQWTLGQRARLEGFQKPAFIARKDANKNIIYVAEGTNHPILYSNICFTGEPHWIYKKPKELEDGNIFECKFKFQHTQNWVDCQIYNVRNKGLIITINEYKRAITPGQYAVLSKNGECLGSARIISTGVSNFSLYYLEDLNIIKVSSILKRYKTIFYQQNNHSDNELKYDLCVS